MSKSGALKRYWSSMDNLHTRLNNNDADGKKARKLFLSLTDDQRYTESNFNKIQNVKKGAKPINKQFVRSSFTKIRNKKEKMLRAEHKQLKKDKAPNLANLNDFIKQNLKNDDEFSDIRELFNSA